MATVSQTYNLSGDVTVFTFAQKVTDENLLSATIDGAAATIDAVEGVANDSEYVRVTIDAALNQAGSELIIYYAVGDVAQLNNFATPANNTPQAFQNEFAQIYQQAAVFSATTDEVDTARGGVADLDTRLSNMDTPVTGTIAVAQAAADAAQADADALEAAVAGLQAGSGVPAGAEGETLTYNAGGVAIPTDAVTIDHVLGDATIKRRLKILKDAIVGVFGVNSGVQVYTLSNASSDEWRFALNADPTTLDIGVTPATITGTDNTKGVVVVRFVANTANSLIDFYHAAPGFGAPASLTLMHRFGVENDKPRMRARVGDGSVAGGAYGEFAVDSDFGAQNILNGLINFGRRQVYTTPGSSTWQHPDPGTAILVTVRMQAGGGGGQRGSVSSGDGGGGGQYIEAKAILTDDLTIVVGGGGQGGQLAGNGGVNGGNSSATGTVDVFSVVAYGGMSGGSGGTGGTDGTWGIGAGKNHNGLQGGASESSGHGTAFGATAGLGAGGYGNFGAAAGDGGDGFVIIEY